MVSTMIVAAASMMSAHLKPTRTLPVDLTSVSAPPSKIAACFNQVPALGASAMRLNGPSGPVSLQKLRVEDGRCLAADAPDSLTPGKYEVAWRTAGDDGHAVRGTFSFVVGTPAS